LFYLVFLFFSYLFYVQKQHRQSGYGFVYYFDSESAYRAMKALKHNTVKDITLDCSISHKSEQAIRYPSAHEISVSGAVGMSYSPSRYNQPHGQMGFPPGGFAAQAGFNQSPRDSVRFDQRQPPMQNMRQGYQSHTGFPPRNQPPQAMFQQQQTYPLQQNFQRSALPGYGPVPPSRDPYLITPPSRAPYDNSNRNNYGNNSFYAIPPSVPLNYPGLPTYGNELLTANRNQFPGREDPRAAYPPAFLQSGFPASSSPRERLDNSFADSPRSHLDSDPYAVNSLMSGFGDLSLRNPPLTSDIADSLASPLSFNQDRRVVGRDSPLNPILSPRNDLGISSRNDPAMDNIPTPREIPKALDHDDSLEKLISHSPLAFDTHHSDSADSREDNSADSGDHFGN
jgi:hypothetical protein